MYISGQVFYILIFLTTVLTASVEEIMTKGVKLTPQGEALVGVSTHSIPVSIKLPSLSDLVPELQELDDEFKKNLNEIYSAFLKNEMSKLVRGRPTPGTKGINIRQKRFDPISGTIMIIAFGVGMLSTATSIGLATASYKKSSTLEDSLNDVNAQMGRNLGKLDQLVDIVNDHRDILGSVSRTMKNISVRLTSLENKNILNHMVVLDLSLDLQNLKESFLSMRSLKLPVDLLDDEILDHLDNVMSPNLGSLPVRDLSITRLEVDPRKNMISFNVETPIFTNAIKATYISVNNLGYFDKNGVNVNLDTPRSLVEINGTYFSILGNCLTTSSVRVCEDFTLQYSCLNDLSCGQYETPFIRTILQSTSSGVLIRPKDDSCHVTSPDGSLHHLKRGRSWLLKMSVGDRLSINDQVIEWTSGFTSETFHKLALSSKKKSRYDHESHIDVILEKISNLETIDRVERTNQGESTGNRILFLILIITIILLVALIALQYRRLARASRYIQSSREGFSAIERGLNSLVIDKQGAAAE